MDVIFNLKRNVSLSLVLCGFMGLTLIFGAVLQRLLTSTEILFYASIFNFCIILPFRFLVSISVTQLASFRTLLSTILQPILYLFSTMMFWSIWHPVIIYAIILASTILLTASFVFIHVVNKHGELAIGIGAINLFKGFLANWLENKTYPLEKHFEKLGSTSDVSIAVLAFGKKESIKALMVVPEIHPGPFRNLGSSNIPYTIQKTLEEKFNAITMVPHGISGHERDLASQQQCDKVLKEIMNLADFSVFSSKATKMIRAEVGFGKATCQMFGDLALVTITCAPISMEDILSEVNTQIIREGKKMGAQSVVVIDAHNSIGGIDEVSLMSDELLKDLKMATRKAIEAAVNELKGPYEIGVAKVIPKEFGVIQGMGAGGITVLVVVIGKHRYAYITIDGNNMVRGLREEIRLSLKDIIDDCEVLTTDTHAVNARSSSIRGYYPIGEVIDHKTLISYIRNLVVQAVSDTQKSENAYRLDKIKNIKVIGEKRLVELSKLVDSTFKFMIKVAPIIFIPAFLSSILSFYILLLR
jgi:putative membrane protein